MRPQRLQYAPTRSRRLNEMLGLCVLAAGGLLLLALVTYHPGDPSFNTLGGQAGARLAKNWTGVLGSYTADLLLQTFGVAVAVVPLILLRTGIWWMRSRPVGAGLAKWLGLALWLVFAPAAIAMLPGHLLWQHALPIGGVTGLLVSGALISLVNLPGAITITAVAVALSIYLLAIRSRTRPKTPKRSANHSRAMASRKVVER